MHLLESVAIPAFRVEKGDNKVDEKGDVFNTFNTHDHIYPPFSPLSLSRILIRSVTLTAILALHASNYYTADISNYADGAHL